MSETIETAQGDKAEAPPTASRAGDAEADHAGGDEHDEHPFLAHHFDTPKHQFESGKLGIWVFLVTEVLFFAGLFCAYSVYRGMHPEIFYWAHFYLDTDLGAVNTIVLIVSSFTAAWAVRNAQLNQQRLLVSNIVITVLCATTFLGIKYVEYSHKFHDGLLWGGRKTADGQEPKYKFDPHHPLWEVPEFEHKYPAAAAAARRLLAAAHPEQPERAEGKTGNPVETATPATASATASAGGTPTSGNASAPERDHGEASTVAAPAPSVAETTAEGGSPAVEVSREEATAALAELAAMAKADSSPPQVDAAVENPLRGLTDEEMIPLLRAGVLGSHAVDPSVPSHPKNAHLFFGIYFFMTGLHGLHVTGGIVVWLWLLRRAIRGEFGSQYFGPIDFAALYWHLVDLIWIYLFPLLYLIH